MTWSHKEYCYLTPEGKKHVDLLVYLGLDFELAMELAFQTFPNEVLYNLEDEHE